MPLPGQEVLITQVGAGPAHLSFLTSAKRPLERAGFLLRASSKGVSLLFSSPACMILHFACPRWVEAAFHNWSAFGSSFSLTCSCPSGFSHSSSLSNTVP